MKRRYIAVLGVFVPILTVAILKLYYPVSYEILGGYMLAMAMVFKLAIMNFYYASKLKLIAYLKGLTFIQGTILLIKRWFLDNVFAKWLKKNITDHIKVGINEVKEYYKSLNMKAKVKNIFLPIVLSVISAWTLYTLGSLNNLMLFAEIKVIVIGISKTVVIMGMKFIGLVVNSWITPIIEVFALSYVFSYFERVFGKDNIIVKLINYIGEKLDSVIFLFSDINKKHIDPLLNDQVSQQSKNISNKLSMYIKNKKISHEFEQFEKLEQSILIGHINAYHTFKGMDKITDKRELYAKINSRTDDNLDIVAYVSRDKNGRLIPENVENSYYHDIFLLEGIASSHRHGVKDTLESEPNHKDFWVLNTSQYPALLKSHSSKITTQVIYPNSVKLIKTDYPQDYTSGDIYFEYGTDKEDIVTI